MAPDPSSAAGTGRRVCGWCEGPIPERARRDARTCSQRCRQAAHRFHRAVVPSSRRRSAGESSTARASCSPRRFAYADPPYPGKAGYYRGHPDFGGEVDPVELVELLARDYPDGWAMSTSADALPGVLASSPTSARLHVAAWFRGERPTAARRPLSAWEPVIYSGGRPYPSPVDARRLDALVYVARPRLTDPRRVIGAKPAAFAAWLFGLLGALPGDELVDLFPGSGGIGRAWELYAAGAVPPGGRYDSGTSHGSTSHQDR